MQARPCARCQRNFDASARVCPFCDWDQQAGAPPPAPSAANVYTAPREHRGRKAMLMSIAMVVMLVAAFIVGARLHTPDPATTSTQKSEPSQAPTARPAGRSNVTLVPVEGNGIEQPITSAPPPVPTQGVPEEYQRHDATAASSDEYTQMLKRAKAEKKMSVLVDPRTLSGLAYEQGPRTSSAVVRTPKRSADMAPEAPVRRTAPVPEYQPVPKLHLSETARTRLDLVVGADGNVREVNLLQPLPRDTAKVIAAIQSWRFRPATQNGIPVEAHFVVDISFNADE